VPAASKPHSPRSRLNQSEAARPALKHAGPIDSPIPREPARTPPPPKIVGRQAANRARAVIPGVGEPNTAGCCQWLSLTNSA